MYIPKHYVNKDIAQTIAFMQRFNFGTIITAIDNIPSATHLPFIVEERNGTIFITSHLAKANPHGNHLQENENLIVFTEPHAYVSPKNYLKKENVPTWNYLAVHAYGKATLIHDEAEVITILEKMIDEVEPEYKAQWSELSDSYKSKMIKGILAFEIEITRIDSKKKLSQNKKSEERQAIIDNLSKSNNSAENTLATYMKKEEL